MLQSQPQSIDAQHFAYLKDLQSSTAGVLFEGSVKLLIRQTFDVVIDAVSKGLDPENRTNRAKAGSTFKALLDIWGKDGMKDSEFSTVRLRPCSGLECSHSFRPVPPRVHGRKVTTGSALRTFPGVHVSGTPSNTASRYLLAPSSQRHHFLHHGRSIGLARCIQHHKCTTTPAAPSRFRRIL